MDMSKLWQVKLQEPEIRKAFVQLAKRKGWTVSGRVKEFFPEDVFLTAPNPRGQGNIFAFEEPRDHCDTISIDEAIGRLLAGPPEVPKKLATIGDDDVVLYPDGSLEAGRVRMSRDAARRIAEAVLAVE